MNDQQPHEYVPTSSVGRSTRPQKVKDTCDMCSASKVRCDKKKPICSRCERLGYPCFYSPARRIRKPHASPSISSSRDEPEAGAVEQRRQLQATNMLNDGIITAESNTLEDATGAFTRKESDAGGPFRASDLELSLFPRPQTTAPPQKNSDNESSRSRTVDATRSSSSCPRSLVSTNPGADCATSAMDLLQDLHKTSSDNLALATSDPESKVGALNVALDAASTSIRRVSNILSCSCSKKPDIGLLTAAVCAALLDIYEIFLHHSARSKNPARLSSIGDGLSQRNWRKKKGGASQYSSSSPGGSEVFDVCTEDLLHGLHERAPIMRILGELHQVTYVVTQFRNRYSQIGEKGPRDLLQALVASIASRLKSIIDEYTNSLAYSDQTKI
ncbi:MAG: hypothetical protein LQ338_006229 [Usnochroma carphineum]|nr:MAG: hypothetical protein LQ338_006229 [Usnochroma carphineum]